MSRMLSTAAFLVGCCVLCLSNSSLQAGEPACTACEPGVPMLSKIPYMNRLFKNVGVGRAEECDVKKPTLRVVGVPVPGKPRHFRQIDADSLERIGIDFDFEIDGPDARGVSHETPTGPISAKCEEEEKLGIDLDEKCEGTTCNLPNVAFQNPGQANASHATPPQTIIEVCDYFLGKIESLHEERTDERSEWNSERMELIEAIIESRVETAQLAAKLEFAAEREKLALENAVLKAQLAVMEERLAALERPAAKAASKTPAKQKR